MREPFNGFAGSPAYEVSGDGEKLSVERLNRKRSRTSRGRSH